VCVCVCKVHKLWKKSEMLTKEKLLLLSLVHVILANEQHKRQRSCWTRDWIHRWPVLDFCTTLIKELENEDAGKFRIMFLWIR